MFLAEGVSTLEETKKDAEKLEKKLIKMQLEKGPKSNTHPENSPKQIDGNRKHVRIQNSQDFEETRAILQEDNLKMEYKVKNSAAKNAEIKDRIGVKKSQVEQAVKVNKEKGDLKEKCSILSKKKVEYQALIEEMAAKKALEPSPKAPDAQPNLPDEKSKQRQIKQEQEYSHEPELTQKQLYTDPQVTKLQEHGTIPPFQEQETVTPKKNTSNMLETPFVYTKPEILKSKEDFSKKIKKFGSHLSSLQDFSTKMRKEIEAEKASKNLQKDAKYEPTEEELVSLVDWNN